MRGTRIRILRRKQPAGEMHVVNALYWPVHDDDEPDQRAAAEAQATHAALELLLTISGCHSRVETAEDRQREMCGVTIKIEGRAAPLDFAFGWVVPVYEPDRIGIARLQVLCFYAAAHTCAWD